MKRSRIITIVVAIVVVITLFYSFQGSQDDTAYVNDVKKAREEKDRFMRSSPESPFTGSTENFAGLNYFPPDSKYRIVADLEPVEPRKPVILATNDGEEQHYIEYAYAVFKLEGSTHKLLILEIADLGPHRGQLFLAFGDETSARETYGAGRYLDVTKTPGAKTITLDFNRAYNPYCAYRETFSCPLPPRENILEIPIRAGEMNYHP